MYRGQCHIINSNDSQCPAGTHFYSTTGSECLCQCERNLYDPVGSVKLYMGCTGSIGYRLFNYFGRSWHRQQYGDVKVADHRE